jgi:hypothetical protein
VYVNATGMTGAFSSLIGDKHLQDLANYRAMVFDYRGCYRDKIEDMKSRSIHLDMENGNRIANGEDLMQAH